MTKPNNQWTWAISYDNGETRLDESTLQGFNNVRIPDVTHLWVYNDTQAYVVIVPPGGRLIFFRRKQKIISLTENKQETRIRAVVFGWQKTVNGENVKSLTWLLPDGTVLVSDEDLGEI